MPPAVQAQGPVLGVAVTALALPPRSLPPRTALAPALARPRSLPPRTVTPSLFLNGNIFVFISSTALIYLSNMSSPADMITVKQTSNTYVPQGITRRAVIGGSNIRIQKVIGDTQAIDSCNFSFQTAGSRTLVSRRWMLTMHVRVTTVPDPTPVTGGPNTFTPLADCPVANPAVACVGSVALDLDGTVTSSPQLYKLAPALLSQLSAEDRAGTYSGTAIAPDGCADWVDLFGRNMSPMAYAGSSPQVSRSEFPHTPDAQDAAGNWYRVYEFTAPLACSPLSSDPNASPMAHLSAAKVTINYQGLGSALNNSIWCHDDANDGGQVWGGVVVTMEADPTLSMAMISLSDDSDPLPLYQEIPFSKPTVFTTNIPTPLAPGASAQTVSASFGLTVVPKVIYAYIRRKSRLTTQTSATCRVDKCAVQFGNTDSLLATLSPAEIYRMSNAAGVLLDYTDYRLKSGGIVAIPVAEALGLKGVSPGSTGVFTVQVTLDFTNQTASDFDGELVVATIAPGMLKFEPGRVTQSHGLFGPVERSEAIEHSETIDGMEGDPHGGGFFSKIKHWVGKHSRGVAKAVRVLSRVAEPIAMAVAPEDAGKIVKGFSTARKITRQVAERTDPDLIAARAGGIVAGGLVAGGLVGGGAGSVRMMRISSQR